VRRAPALEGRAGFIRIDSVDQGDHDGIRGPYYINAVDCVTQWQVVATDHPLSEACMLPVIKQMLDQLPFKIVGFHADNASEYVNHRVAKMLDKLKVEFTRSRHRHSNDNGLAMARSTSASRAVGSRLPSATIQPYRPSSSSARRNSKAWVPATTCRTCRTCRTCSSVRTCASMQAGYPLASDPSRLIPHWNLVPGSRLIPRWTGLGSTWLGWPFALLIRPKEI